MTVGLDTAWEYRFVVFDGTQLEKLNELGAEGWEAVGVMGAFAVMKRSVTTSVAADG